MTKTEAFQKILTSAAISAKKKAFKQKLPFAISENGEVKLVYPDNKVKVLSKKIINK